MRARPLMPVFLALLMMLGPFGHVVPSSDSSTLEMEMPSSTSDAGQSPAWDWAVKGGGSAWEYGGGIYESGNDISLDSSGNSLIIGNFYESASFGGNGLSSVGEHDIFVAKLSSSGSWLWAVSAGSSADDSGVGITVDSSGNAFVIGHFKGSSIDFGSTTLSSSGGAEIFVAKVSSSGSWEWAVKAGGSLWDQGASIAVDLNGNVFVTGKFESTASFGSTTLTSDDGESREIFIAKLSNSGTWLWAVSAGGPSRDYGSGIAVDNTGNAFVTGSFQATANFGSTTLSSSGDADIFVAKLSGSGSWIWATKAGGTSRDYGSEIAVDSNGNQLVTGSFESTATFGSSSVTSEGYSDIFISKLNSAGTWVWTVGAGSSNTDRGIGIALDQDDNVFVTGVFRSTVTFGSTTHVSSDGHDIFVSKLSNSGSWLWTLKAGGEGTDAGNGISVDTSGNPIICGYFYSTSTFGSTDLSSRGDNDIFVAKIYSSEGNSNEGNSGSILQQPNHDWKNGLLCRVELLCFQKMVSAADDADKLTYIDQEVIITIPNTDGTESVNAIITDENGAIVLRQPMTCTFVGGSSTCTGDIAIETQEVKAYFDDTIGDIVHDGLAEFFKNEAAGLTTSILVKIAIPVVCVVVGIIAGVVSAGVAAIPVGSACYHALWGLYVVVKSITFLLSLVTYYNIVDDNLGSYENKVFPNRYVSAIEVNGVTRDMVDVRLDRLNDVSESELEEIGKHDSLEFIGLSPIDFQLSRNGATLADDEDLLRISGDSAFEMMLVIDPEQHDAVIVEGTGDGTYSIIGIYNDADISVGNYDDEEAVFANLFMAEEDVSISDGEIINYVDHDSMNWYNEADMESSWAKPLNIALIILSIISLAGACYFMVLKRSKGKDDTQTTKLPEGMPPRVNTPKGMPLGNPMMQQQPMIPQQPMMQQQPMIPPEGMPARGQPLPSANWKGVWGADGYERLEHPQGSGVWYWRDQQTGQWVRH